MSNEAKVMVTVTRNGKTATYQLEPANASRKGTFQYYSAPKACPDIPDWGKIPITADKATSKSAKASKASK